MKNKVLVLIIGILIGALITSIGFFIYEKVNTKEQQPGFSQNGNMPQMPNDGNGNGQTPPDKPGDSNKDSSSNSSNGQQQTNNNQNQSSNS